MRRNPDLTAWENGGGRTSRSPVGFHRPHAFPMRAGPRPVRPPKWPPRRAKRAMHAERRTEGAGQRPEFRDAKRVNCTRRRSAQPSYGGQARTYDVRGVAGCLLPHAEKVEPRAGCAPASPGYRPGTSLPTLAGQTKIGRRGGMRAHTPLRATDFEAVVYTDSNHGTMGPPLGFAPGSSRYQRDASLSRLRRHGPGGRNCTSVVPRDGWVTANCDCCSATPGWEMGARAGFAPAIFAL